MKKLSIFACAMAFLGLTFTACNKDNEPKVEIPDGFYVVGPATTVASIDAIPTELSKALMAAGTNEADDHKKRDGMYEKYIALEAGKEFSLVLRETNVQSEKGYDVTVYGAKLEEKEAETDNAEIAIMMYWGQLKEDTMMTVPKSGLYHIILDLNKLGDLTSTGGAQIAITPVDWAIRGGFIDANWTQSVMATSNSDFDKEHMTATWENVEVKADGEFKFVSQDCWKIQLDQGGQVKAETSIGQANGEMTTVGSDINIPIERGIYTLVLNWDLKGGALGKSFTYTATKTGDPKVEPYVPGDHVVGISGSMNGWAAPSGATRGAYNAAESNFDATTYAGTYVYETEGIVFDAGSQFKFRFDDAWIGTTDGVEIVGVTTVAGKEGDGSANTNFAGVEGCYKIKISINWDGAQRKGYKAEFTAAEPPVGPTFEYVSGRVLVENKSDISNINLYGWAPDKDNNSEIFGGWPGKAAGNDVVLDGVTYKEFTYTKGIKDAEYKFIVNGEGGQTSDPTWTVAISGADVKLVVNADKTLAVK